MLMSNSPATKADIEQLRKEIKAREVVNGVGYNVRNTGVGKLLQIIPQIVLAKIVSATRIGTANAWTYSIEFVDFQADRTTVDTGITADAYNTLEINNPSDGTGLHGNGVDNSAADWPAGYDIMPAPADAIIEVKQIKGVYVFEYCNGVDGSCLV